MSNINRRLVIRLVVLVVSLVFGADIYVSAQNSNSSMTMPDTTMQNTNSSTTTPSTGRRRRRRRRSAAAAMPNTTPACGPMDSTTPAGGGMPAATPVRYGRCDPNVQEQTDLSGTYTGTVNYSEGGLSGDATLTITGNDFTVTSGSSTQEGRVVAVTTCNYTAVTMMFGKSQMTAASGPQPPPLPAVSLRAKKTGKGITLTSVEKREFSFMSSGGGGSMGGGRRRGKRAAIKPPTVIGVPTN